ncbi:MAG: DegT/DnrJ/EryC1/StrS family aminotransferase [Phycisphaerae bacterium]|nr:DegT/DnrJ/EryC1/StrS family aminotransferase [Phycisphaerae bacterium]
MNTAAPSTLTVPFVDLKAQFALIGDEVLDAIGEVCRDAKFCLGPAVEEFEKGFAEFCETRYCVAVNSGTSALHLALRCLDIGPGDEVITVPATFVATTWAISYVRATPVFVDIDPAARTMDPALLEAAITPKTKAIMPVHLYGQPADMGPILKIAAAHGLPVVEDAAQAHGATYRKDRVGGIGRIGCFSFYPGKNLGAYGEGGALVTNDENIAKRARALRDHGQRQRYVHEEIGYNYRMEGIQGAVLSIKLDFIDEWNAARRQHAADYIDRLTDLPGLTLPKMYKDRKSVFHLFVVELNNRDGVARKLNEAGVQTGLHYPVPVHLQPAYRDLGLTDGAFPNSERLAKRCLSLPIFPELTSAQIDHVCEQLAANLFKS